MKKRIIATLCIKDGEFTRTRNFCADHVYSSDFIYEDVIDELILINIDPDVSSSHSFLNFIERNIFRFRVPVAVAGGIKSTQDASRLFGMGIDKICINSAVWERPDLVPELCQIYGAQSITVSIDLLRDESGLCFFDWRLRKTHSLTEKLDYLSNVEENFGELLVQFVNNDGTVYGTDLEGLDEVGACFDRKAIACGSGFGTWQHYLDAASRDFVSGICVQNVHHLSRSSLINIKQFLGENNIKVRAP